MTARKTLSNFLEEAKAIHNDRYDYSETIYKGYRIKFKMKCKKCGKIIELTPCYHIREKIGCRDCYPNKCTWTKRKTKEVFLKEARKKHGNNYEYSCLETESVCANDLITIKCNNCGKEFKQSVREHLRGCGCSNRDCINKRITKTCLRKYGVK